VAPLAACHNSLDERAADEDRNSRCPAVLLFLTLSTAAAVHAPVTAAAAAAANAVMHAMFVSMPTPFLARLS
jgi:hypothetical protein